MTFRRPKTDSHHRSQEWDTWIERNRLALVGMGLPAEVFLDEARWNDFLENGHLHWHESSGFEFGQLSSSQLASLKRFLELEYGAAERPPPLLGWAQVRDGESI